MPFIRWHIKWPSIVHSRSPLWPPCCTPPRLQVLGEELLGREREVAVLRAELAEELARAKQDGASAVAERAKLQVARAVGSVVHVVPGVLHAVVLHIASVCLGETCVHAWWQSVSCPAIQPMQRWYHCCAHAHRLPPRTWLSSRLHWRMRATTSRRMCSGT